MVLSAPTRAAILLAALAYATGAGAEEWRIVPTIGFSETYTDNIALVGSELAQGGWISDLSPGLRISGAGARIKLNADYRYHKLYYSERTFDESAQQTLNATGTIEAIEKWFYVDAFAGIMGQNRSPFGGAVSVDLPTSSRNRLETQVVQLSPYVRGQVANALYQVRYNASWVRTDEDAVLPATRVGEVAARVRNATFAARIGWALDANSLAARNDAIGNVDDSRVRASIIFAVNPTFYLSGSFGHESTDFLGPERQTNDMPGGGFTWNPSDRTQMGAIVEKRFFGTGHSAQLTYRAPRTAFRLASTRDAAVLPSVVSTAASTSVLGVLNDLLASTIVDPEERARAARRRLEDTGAPAGFPLATSFVTAQPVVVSGLTGSVAYIGPRATLTGSVARVEQRRSNQPFAEELGGNDGFRQLGFSGTLTYKLTPLTSINATGTSLRAKQLALTQITTRQNIFSLTLVSKLGPKASVSLGVRHSDFESPAEALTYRENAVVGTVQVEL